MADVRNDPSMEEILASIKRIIADDTAAAMDKPRPRNRETAQSATPKPASAPDEVLELTDQVVTEADAAEPAEPIIEQPAAWPAFEPEKAALSANDSGAPATEPELISATTAEASRQAFAMLSSSVARTPAGQDQTLEGLVREMLRPMLKEWLDARLPELVEGVVQREIARIAGRTL